MHEKSVAEIDLPALTRGRKFYPSPNAWEDQVLYFLLVDRFSDGHEKGGFLTNDGKHTKRGKTPLFDAKEDTNRAVRTKAGAAKWREAGGKFVGGTIKGLTSKLGYLKRLGVTAIWVSPVWKQCAFDENSYHGYGTQNFLGVEPRFGTREDLQELVQTAHKIGIYVVLDIILNHAGNVFAYEPDAETLFQAEGEHPVKGWRDKSGKPTIPFGPLDNKKHPSVWPDGAVWPVELQTPDAFHRKGEMRDWDAVPESVEGDFFGFKDMNLGHSEGNAFVPSDALKALCTVFKFWIATTDIDGFRVDTLKNMGRDAVRFFSDEIHQWAHHLGKRNFYLFGEITGDDARATDKMLTDFGVDGAFWLGTVPLSLRDVVTGRRGAPAYFDLHRGSTEERKSGGAMEWYRSHYAAFFDDHDQVGSKVKHRFASEFGDDRVRAEQAILRAIGVTATTLGIPCLYYGTEQGFNGHALTPEGGDNYVREAMFGGGFGAFGSHDRHFFNEESRLYREAAAIFAVRADEKALRQGNQFLREVSVDGEQFAYPQPVKEGEGGKPYRGLVVWSRIIGTVEVVCALNTDDENAVSSWVTVDAERHRVGGRKLRCLYSTDAAQTGTETSGPPEAKNGSAVCLTVPPGGFVIFR